jgi:hypothetical protein
MTWGSLVLSFSPLLGPTLGSSLHCAYKASRHSAVRRVADSKVQVSLSSSSYHNLPALIFRHSLSAPPLPCLAIINRRRSLGHYLKKPLSTQHSLASHHTTRSRPFQTTSGLGYIVTTLKTSSHLNSPSMPAKKLRCNAKDCREAAQRIVGDCTFCNGHFCGKHRLLEDHKCSGLEDVS